MSLDSQEDLLRPTFNLWRMDRKWVEKKKVLRGIPSRGNYSQRRRRVKAVLL